MPPPSWSTEIQNLLQSLSGLCGSHSLVNSGFCFLDFSLLTGKEKWTTQQSGQVCGLGLSSDFQHSQDWKETGLSLVMAASVYYFCPTVWKVVGRRRKKR